jgi:hypothetical protein
MRHISKLGFKRAVGMIVAAGVFGCATSGYYGYDDIGYGPMGYWDDWGPDVYVWGGPYYHHWDHDYSHRGYASRSVVHHHGDGHQRGFAGLSHGDGFHSRSDFAGRGFNAGAAGAGGGGHGGAWGGHAGGGGAAHSTGGGPGGHGGGGGGGVHGGGGGGLGGGGGHH